MATPEGGTIAVYETLEKAEEAVRTLGENGFPIANISIIATDLTSERDIHGVVTTGDIAKLGLGVGGWAGGIFGLLIGAAFVWVPGFGPLLVAGPVAAMLLGGIEGAAVGAAGGGVLGGLVGLGLSRAHTLKYEDHLRGGRYLVIASGTAEEIERAEDLLRQNANVALDTYGARAADLASVK